MKRKILLTYAIDDERIALNLSEYDLRYVRTGIGKAKSCIRLWDAIHTEQPNIVMNIGTAGSLTHQVGEIFVCHKFIDRDFQKIQISGLEFKQSTNELFEGRDPFLQWKPAGVCNTGDSFLTEVSEMEGDVFDMEAYAQALLCKEKNIPFLSIKYVTDIIGQNSVKHWEEKLADARKGLKLFLENHLF